MDTCVLLQAQYYLAKTCQTPCTLLPCIYNWLIMRYQCNHIYSIAVKKTHQVAAAAAAEGGTVSDSYS